MQKLGVWAGFALLMLSTAARAQDAPKAEIFGGYSYSRAGGGNSGSSFTVNERVAIRLVQADYLLTTFSADSGIYCITTPCPTIQSDTQHNVRLSFGIVARFGGR